MTRDVFIREIRQSESMLYHVAKSILKNDSDCADAVQETLLKAYEKLHTLKQDQFFRTWITRILINECNGILRKRKCVISYEEYMENSGAAENKKYTHLYMAILNLPEELRILVTLYYYRRLFSKGDRRNPAYAGRNHQKQTFTGKSSFEGTAYRREKPFLDKSSRN